MKNKTNKKKLIILICSFVAASIALAVAIPFTIYGIKSASIKKDYHYLKDDATYSSKVEVTGVELVTQHISCGYATIEMMSSFYGKKVTEDELSNRNGGRISTQTSKGFLDELNKSVSDKSFIKHSYLNNDVLLKEVHASLEKGNPVALEWAALYENEWTLHFSLISGLDINNDQVTVYNPYGIIENISVDEFVSRTTFEAYTNMPLFLSFGFAYGAFEKNTIFFCE